MSTANAIKLSTWAHRQGIHPKTAFRWIQAGKLPQAFQSPTGRWYVPVEEDGSVVLYGRVSSSDQKEDLDRQMQRLRDYAAASGLKVEKEVSEVGSGLNGKRRKLMSLLSDASVSTIVVEHRDRLARLGFDYIESALSARGSRIHVINEEESKDDLVQDFVDVVTSMCSRIYGRRSAKNRAERAVKAAEDS